MPPARATPTPRRAGRAAPGRASRAADARLEGDAAAVFDVMTELLRVYQFRDRDRVGPHGVTVTQSYALEALLRRGELTAKELAHELALEKSTVSRLVDGMAGRGLVERVGHPSDARSALLRATPLGRRVRGAIRRDVTRENMAALGDLTAAQRDTFVGTLRRFAEAARLRIRGEGAGAAGGGRPNDPAGARRPAPTARR